MPKHISIKYHFIRNVVSLEVIKLEKISTHHNSTNMDTKISSLGKFKACKNLLNIEGVDWLRWNWV